MHKAAKHEKHAAQYCSRAQTLARSLRSAECIPALLEHGGVTARNAAICLHDGPTETLGHSANGNSFAAAGSARMASLLLIISAAFLSVRFLHLYEPGMRR